MTAYKLSINPELMKSIHNPERILDCPDIPAVIKCGIINTAQRDASFGFVLASLILEQKTKMKYSRFYNNKK